MLRKGISAVMASALLLTGCVVQPASTQRMADSSAPRPNVIVILADDLGYADVSSYGIKRISTPNIDRIGTEGVRFTDGYASAPVCSPSRAGLQTGRYQERFGFEFNNGGAKRDLDQHLGIDNKEITIAQALQTAGYHTGMIGKWHLGSAPEFYPMKRGYQEYVGFLSGASSYMSPEAPDLVTWKPDGVDDDGGRIEHRNPLNAIYEGADKKLVNNEDQYLTDFFGDRAVDYINRNAKSADPYFLYIAFNAPHAPYMVTKKYYDRFPMIENKEMRVYAAMISALDDQVGRILDAVDKSGEANNTIVVFVSDNGCAGYVPGLCSCQPLRGGKLTHYEGGVRVPYMIRWPKMIKAGQWYRNPVSTMDLFPTTVAAAGGELAKDRVYDGVNLMPYLTGKNPGEPHNVLYWRREPLVSIRKGDWKLWKHQKGEYTLLFNLKDDPNETTNLATKNPAKVKELEDAIQQWAKDLQDPRWPTKNMITYDVCGTPFTVPI